MRGIFLIACQLGAMLLWRFGRKMLPECYSVCRAPFGPPSSCKPSDCIVLCANWRSAVPIWYKPFGVLLRAVSVQPLDGSGLDDEIFLIERSLAWKVHCSAAWLCSQKMSSPSILCSRTGTNCWPQIKYCTVKKEELWHLCCHTVHLRPRCAPGPILLWNWTNWCLEMHPAAVLKHSEPFVSILQDINRTFISSANAFLSSTVLLTGRALCYLSSCKYLHKNMFKARDNSHYWCLCRASLKIFTLLNCGFSHIWLQETLQSKKGIFCCVRIWHW